MSNSIISGNRNPLSRLFKTIAAAFLIIAAAGTLYANLRAPYNRGYKNSSHLIRADGLVLVSEHLQFSFDHYFTGEAGKVSEEKNFCTINASYKVHAESDMTAEFEFISPSPELLEAGVNGAISKFNVIELNRTPDTQQKRWGAEFYEDLYSFKFSGKLIKGENTITVKYIQPAGVNETEYGYFSKSRWSTFAGYEFSPIKEWKRNDKFTAEIEVSVPYDWGIMDYIFNPDVLLDVTGFDKDHKQKYKPDTSKIFRNNNYITQKFSFTGELPDKLIISVSEE